MGVPRLLIGDTEAARKSLGRIMRAYLSGGLPRDIFRDLCYSFSVLLGYFKQEADQRIEDRLDAIEAVIEGKQHETSANSTF